MRRTCVDQMPHQPIDQNLDSHKNAINLVDNDEGKTNYIYEVRNVCVIIGFVRHKHATSPILIRFPRLLRSTTPDQSQTRIINRATNYVHSIKCGLWIRKKRTPRKIVSIVSENTEKPIDCGAR